MWDEIVNTKSELNSPNKQFPRNNAADDELLGGTHSFEAGIAEPIISGFK